MRFAHIAEQIYFRPWFITPAGHAALRLVFERAVASGLREPTDEELRLSDLFPKRRALTIDSDGIASVHVLGPLGKNLSKMEKSCGATSFEDVRADYQKAVDEGARGVLIDFESPGGTSQGTPELASFLARKPIPTVAFTDTIMASAAYYLASSADAIVASPSADVGSIGTFIPWIDSSARYEREGLKPDPIIAKGGDLKAMGFGGKLTDVQRDYLQHEIDEHLDDFKAHIRSYRAVGDDAMRGQCMSGRAALRANLIDCIGEREQATAMLRSRLPHLATAA